MNKSKHGEEEQHSASELTPKERKMLQSRQDMEYLDRWDKIAKASDRKDQIISNLRWLAVIAIIVAVLFFMFGDDLTANKSPKLKSSEIAGLLDYPFSGTQVRGEGKSSVSEIAWEEALALYQKGAYQEALKKSKEIHNPFFAGMCLLKENQFDAAIKQFDEALLQQDPIAEVYYYKAYALYQLGRKDESRELCRATLDRNVLRGPWEKAAKALLE